MDKLFEKEHTELLGSEIYEESAYRDDDDIIWVCSEDGSTNSAGQVQTTEYLSLDHQHECGPSLTFCDLREQSVGVTSEPTVESTSPLTYRPIEQFRLPQWFFRVLAFACILLIGNLLPAILEHAVSSRAKASTAVDGASARTYSADPQGRTPVRVLTVMAGRQETIKDISIRYLGHFDHDLFEEICSLNPTLKDPDHLEDGQLIRIPLRPGHRVTD
jgi:hypothetical protein